MAVSIVFNRSQASILANTIQADSYPEDSTSSLLYDWNHICTHRGAIVMGELASMSYIEILPSTAERLILVSFQVQEIVIDYSDCQTKASDTDFTPMHGLVTSHFKSTNSNTVASAQWKKGISKEKSPLSGIELDTPVCSIQFGIPDNIGPPVLFYYRLTNFYQNHRRYVKSLDSNQLKGDASSNSTIYSGTCDPLRLNASGFAYYPCGLIANSLFNDTFLSPVLLDVQDGSAPNKTYSMSNKGIAWDSDKQLYKPTKYNWDQVTPPENWRAHYPDFYTEENPPPNLHDNEEFQVWMRTAGLPTFSKLALRNDADVMTSGTYQVDIWDSKLIIR